MFCHHHDETEVFGAEPVPCPFCGFPGGQARQPEEPDTDHGFQDSNDALRHALLDTEHQRGSSETNTYW